MGLGTWEKSSRLTHSEFRPKDFLEELLFLPPMGKGVEDYLGNTYQHVKVLGWVATAGNRAQIFLLGTESRGRGVSLVMWLPVKLGICCGSNTDLEQRRAITLLPGFIWLQSGKQTGRRKADQGGGYCRSLDAWSWTRVVAVEVE